MRSKWYYSSLGDNTLPSQVPEYDWISCTYEETQGGVNTTVGSWEIPCKTPQGHDNLWTKLKPSLYRGKLGCSMKSSTYIHVAYIFTYIYTKDWRNIDDVRRVLSAIRSLDIEGTIYYSPDKQKLLGMGGSIYISRQGER